MLNNFHEYMVVGGMPAIVIAGALLLLLGYAPKGLKESIISLAICVAAIIVIIIALYRRKIFKIKGKKRKLSIKYIYKEDGINLEEIMKEGYYSATQGWYTLPSRISAILAHA